MKYHQTPIVILSALLIVFIPLAGAQEIRIVDVYSDIESADITVHADRQYSDVVIDADMILDGKVLKSHRFVIDTIDPGSDITKILFWDLNIPPKGSYRTRITLSLGGSVLETTYSNFSYGSPTIPRIFIKDIVPDSSGITVILAPYTTQTGTEPILADVDYMLLDGDTIVYRTTDRRIIVDHATPLSREWNVRLDNNHRYSARVKARISSPRAAVIAESEDFISMDDARITELFRDGTGASITVVGRSQVPFTGDVIFTVSKNGSIIEEKREPSPILMSEDDETIEVIWSSRLPAGIYDLSIRVEGNDGDVVDRWETIIEAKQSGVSTARATPAPTQTPGFGFYLAVLSIIAVITVTGRKDPQNG